MVVKETHQLVGIDSAGEIDLHRDLPWYAAQTRSRHEKSVAAQLSWAGVYHWLPILRQRHKWSDRFAFVQVPLFPGYVFVSIDTSGRLDVLKVRGVVRLVGFGDRSPSPIPMEELEAVRLALASRLRIDPYPLLHEGQTVQLRRGPLKGVRGVLIKKNRTHRIVLSVKLVQQSIAVEIDAADVEPI